MPQKPSLSPAEKATLLEELKQVTAQDKALNGPVFPSDSLHARNVLCITCELCRKRAELQFKLGLRL